MKNLKKLSLCAMLAAITCIATMFSLPVGANGYIHIGDGAVLCCAYLLGPLSGSVCASLGSALADLLLGYAYYAPATLVIKLLDAAAAGAVFTALRKKAKIPTVVSLSLSGACGSVIMIAGYFLHSLWLLGDTLSAALTSILPNSMQALTGIVLSTLLYKMIKSHQPLAKHFE